jgi:uncharacterized damage-inducible protein DinB
MIGEAMTEIARIQDQLQRAYDGDAWHGPSLCAILCGVTAQKAAAKPIPASHSIWELVLHVAVWQRIVVRRLAGETIVEIPEEQNFPLVKDASEEAWRKTLEELRQAHRQLYDAIGRLSDERLGDIISGKGYTAYFMLHGVVQHNLYHAGQIAILKKA